MRRAAVQKKSDHWLLGKTLLKIYCYIDIDIDIDIDIGYIHYIHNIDVLSHHHHHHLSFVRVFSIEEGKFPEMWKIGVVTPALKKGSSMDKNNYRPVSCLSVLSKVLEKVICDQITGYMESNNLLPKNQHGFRSGRSTMSALSSIQKEWASSSIM